MSFSNNLESFAGETALTEEKSPAIAGHEGSRTLLWSRWEVGLYVALFLIAIGLRVWDLGARTMHHDESLHALYSWYLAVGSGYEHSPMMHGPLQFHVTALVYKIFWDSDALTRLPPAIFGSILVLIPILLRSRIGRLGALLTAFLLTFSGPMLYFSRFARNDIYMAVWTFGIVAFIWKYLDTGKLRYLFLLALFLAFAFSTKETAYIVVLILAAYLFILSVEDLVGWLRGRLKLSEISRPTVLLLLICTLSLPMWSAGAGLLQGFSGDNLVLVNLEPLDGPVGVPLRDGFYLSIGIVMILLAVSFFIGLRWRPWVWLGSVALYYLVWMGLHTTLFSNLEGLGTGMWQGLGYWIAQQGVARGGQPWYYYAILLILYEPLILVAGISGIGYYLWRGDRFTRFLVFWSLLTLISYTYASEKMPWLLVNVALPLIVLAGRFSGEIAEKIRWNKIVQSGGLLVIVGVPLHFFFLVRLVLIEPWVPQFWGATVGAIATLAVIIYAGWNLGVRRGLPLIGLVFLATLFLFGTRAGFIATYGSAGDPHGHGDVPVEMLVYTQSSPDIKHVLDDIERLSSKFSSESALKITVDGTDGFTWPWAWYLRHYPVSYVDYDQGVPDQTPDASIVLLNARNRMLMDTLLDRYIQSERMEHRWWFPEVYRAATVGKLWEGVTDSSKIQRVLFYLIYRQLPAGLDSLGSVDFYYFLDPSLGPLEI